MGAGLFLVFPSAGPGVGGGVAYTHRFDTQLQLGVRAKADFDLGGVLRDDRVVGDEFIEVDLADILRFVGLHPLRRTEAFCGRGRERRIDLGNDDEGLGGLHRGLDDPDRRWDPDLLGPGDVVVAISTGGASPTLAASLRARVEAVVPIEEPLLHARLLRLIDAYLQDNCTAWDMQADGSFVRRIPEDDSRAVQATLMAHWRNGLSDNDDTVP